MNEQSNYWTQADFLILSIKKYCFFNIIAFLLLSRVWKEKEDVDTYLSSLELVLETNLDKIINVYNISRLRI